MNWYALKIFYNRVPKVIRFLEENHLEYYSQEIMPAYLFVRCSRDEIQEIKNQKWDTLMVYTDVEKRPAIISDKEMMTFKLVTSNGADGLVFLGEDLPEYHKGDLVRVTSGPFEGAEGYIKRIKKDRKLVVSINGIVAVAINGISASLLEKVETPHKLF